MSKASDAKLKKEAILRRLQSGRNKKKQANPTTNPATSPATSPAPAYGKLTEKGWVPGGNSNNPLPGQKA